MEEASDIEEPGFFFDSGFLLLALPDVSDSAFALSTSASSGRWLLFWVAPLSMVSFAVVLSFNALLKTILRGVQFCFLLFEGMVAQAPALVFTTESKSWSDGMYACGSSLR